MNIETIDKWLNEEYGVSYTDLEELHNRQVDKIIELQEKYTQVLEVAQERFDRIQKAIEYIEWNLEANEEIIEYFNCDMNFNKILNILKGGNNE